jgi:hypothetical protein
MASKLPYSTRPGGMVAVLKKIKEAKVPDRFTADFLSTTLNLRGGTYKEFIPLAKKLGLLQSDGTPSELYKKFRNSHTSAAAMARALRTGYTEAFERNENANNLNKEQFKGLVVEITGLEQKARVVQLICQTYDQLKTLADFTASLDDKGPHVDEEAQTDSKSEDESEQGRDFDLNLCYTINLVLPKTDDPAVFNAIFRSLRDNLMRK